MKESSVLSLVAAYVLDCLLVKQFGHVGA